MLMQTISSKLDLREALAPRRTQRIVLVPTMGALHCGHKALLDEARRLAGKDGTVVISIFLNPIQFNNPADLTTYPRSLDEDLALCESSGVDFAFLPTPEIMYAADRSIIVDELTLSHTLCGASRPGHFTGVCTVVNKLFNIVQPTDALFGKKDFQQLAIIRRMVRDLDIPVTIHGVEIVRESSGLAFSSRNARLTQANRQAAPILREVLLTAQEKYRSGTPHDIIRKHATDTISNCQGTVIDYIDIVHAETMQPLAVDDFQSPALMALAVSFGDVRLIDNIEL
ncbi:MAG: pantoate--beta-alanine ligase [Akkermansia sp.]